MRKISFKIGVAFLFLLSLLPFPVLYFLADILHVILFHLIKYRRNVVQANLKNAFPEKSEKERKQIEKKFFRFLADLILESVKMASMSEGEIKKRLLVTNPEVMNQYIQAGRPVLLATGHYGNWEWGNLVLPLYFRKVLIVYKPLTSKNAETLINKMRARFGAILVSMKQTLRKMASLRPESYLAVLVNDQTPARVDAQYFTEFLNQPTAVFLGIEKLAKSGNYPVFYGAIIPQKRGHYTATFKLLTDEPKATADFEITQLHIRELENVIREKPEYWLWSHKRWKFKPEDLK